MSITKFGPQTKTQKNKQTSKKTLFTKQKVGFNWIAVYIYRPLT